MIVTTSSVRGAKYHFTTIDDKGFTHLDAFTRTPENSVSLREQAERTEKLIANHPVCETCPHNLRCLAGKPPALCAHCGQTMFESSPDDVLMLKLIDAQIYDKAYMFMNRIHQKMAPVPIACPFLTATTLDWSAVYVNCDDCRTREVHRFTILSNKRVKVYLKALRVHERRQKTGTKHERFLSMIPPKVKRRRNVNSQPNAKKQRVTNRFRKGARKQRQPQHRA